MQTFRLCVTQESHGNRHLGDLLFWARQADVFSPLHPSQQEPEDEPQQQNFIPNPAAEEDSSAPAKLNTGR